VRTKVLKINHINYTTVKPHEITNIYKLGHDENQKQNQKQTLVSSSKTEQKIAKRNNQTHKNHLKKPKPN